MTAKTVTNAKVIRRVITFLTNQCKYIDIAEITVLEKYSVYQDTVVFIINVNTYNRDIKLKVIAENNQIKTIHLISEL